LFQLTVSITQKRTPVIAGLARLDAQAIRLAEEAQKAGVDYLCAAPPSFVRPNQEEMAAHFEGDCASNQHPSDSLQYSYVGRKCPWCSCGEILGGADTANCRHQDSGGDLTVLNDLLLGRRWPDFGVVTGIDTLVLPGLLAGSQGAILGSANVCPELSLEVLHSFDAGRWEDVGKCRIVLRGFWLAMGLAHFQRQ